MRNRVCERELLTFILVSPKCRCASPAARSSKTCRKDTVQGFGQDQR